MPVVSSSDFDFYLQLLEQHDWTHEYSDDYRAWARGSANEHSLYNFAQSRPQYMAAFKAYRAYNLNIGDMTREDLNELIQELRLDYINA